MLQPEDFTFNGLFLGLEIDADKEPKYSTVEYRNHKTGLMSFRSQRIQVTIESAKISGISSLFFRFLGREVGLYASQAEIQDALGPPVRRRIDSLEVDARRAFYSRSTEIGTRENLIQWSYGEGLDVFFTNLDLYEGFQFREHKFWSIAIGNIWLPPA